jgi:WD40-like Beta Propeller Repeat
LCPQGLARPFHHPNSRCLTKDPKQRLRDIGDARIEIDAIDEVLPNAAAPGADRTRSATHAGWLPWVALAAIALAMAVWLASRPAPAEWNPLAGATFSRVTDWDGTEEHAEISPDGRFVAFLADRAGQLDVVWVSQFETGTFDNLTLDIPPMLTPSSPAIRSPPDELNVESRVAADRHVSLA